MNQIYDLIIVGAGASGLAAAISAGERNRKVLILEKGDRPGRKILASGNGRCNLLNSNPPAYFGESNFAKQVLSVCPFNKIQDFLYRSGLIVTEESNGRYYPVTFQSSTVLSMLRASAAVNGVEMLMNSEVVSAKKDSKEGFTVSTVHNCHYRSRNVLIATGGAAQPRIGGSQDGYQILQKHGHTIVPVFPALVPLLTDSKSISGLSGIRARCSVRVCNPSGPFHCEEGEILFTDYGVSGICIMQCARFADEHSHLEINFLHNIFSSWKQALEEMKRRQRIFHDLSPQFLLEGILAGRIAYAVMKQAGIPLHGEKACQLNDRDLCAIAQTASAYRIEITGNRGNDYAQVSAGGAACCEFEPDTMESKIVHGLFAAGEVLNVDGDCGGYNLMFAIASGIIAGNSV